MLKRKTEEGGFLTKNSDIAGEETVCRSTTPSLYRRIVVVETFWMSQQDAH